ncbi:ceramide glucosyltransferase [Anthonomus grandis grandis]|uniref:ceramide glucosyltransferase n=1 Tax=Anthonomus grandis grandis TaxID=2921223 RepID=UPI002165F6B8|nr:ceramide glucosyltransferase [Anthonomus grandis grandis]
MAPMIYTLYGFAIFFFVFWCAMWLLHVLAILYGKFRLHRKIKELPPDVPYPGISILKPLMGVDPNLLSNLETFFTMQYPTYEILFCIEDEKDPSIELVNSLIEKYPKVATNVFIGGSTVSVNPKINNMHKAFEASNYDFILISDSGIRMREDTLQDMVGHMTETTGIVHQMPFTCDRPGFAATLEKIYFGTAQSRMYLSADCFRINCHTGMSTLMRKCVLVTKEGGLKSFGCYLAEDFFISKYFLDMGWRTRISSQPAMQNSGTCDVRSFQARLSRWAKLRMAMLPLVIVFEPLTECMVIGACAAWATSLLFRWEPVVFYLIHILVWLMCDWILLSIVQNGSLPFSKFDFIVGWLFRECTGPYLFILAVFDPSIRWRNRCFKLSWGGIAQEVKPRIKC